MRKRLSMLIAIILVLAVIIVALPAQITVALPIEKEEVPTARSLQNGEWFYWVTVPNTPKGPSIVGFGVTATFSTGGSVASYDLDVQYRFDWGDGKKSPWLSPSSYGEDVSATHSWSTNGTYDISARARIATHTTVKSEWSYVKTVTINPPETIKTPSPPTGPYEGEVGETLAFSTGGAESNLGHDVLYRFDWGDGKQSPWLSPSSYGEDVSATHSWSTEGTYDISARARCATHTTVKSDWSDVKTVTILAPAPPASPTPTSPPASPTPTTPPASPTPTTPPASPTPTAPPASPTPTAPPASPTPTSPPASPIPATPTPTPDETVSTPATPTYYPETCTVGDTLTFFTGGANCSIEGHDVQYHFDWGDGTFSGWSSEPIATYSWSAAGNYTVRAQARCATNTYIESPWSDGKTVTVYPKHTVSTPKTPTGPSIGGFMVTMTFETGGANCSKGHDVEYLFDWGDGTFSDDWSSETTATHSWSEGTYNIRARARCAAHTLVESSWSGVKTVTINPREWIKTPRTPKGPSSFLKGQLMTFSTGGATSNLKHDVEYLFDWGDGTFSYPWSSKTTATHRWSIEGTYDIRARARCATHKDVMSLWTGVQRVSVSSETDLTILDIELTQAIQDLDHPVQLVKDRATYARVYIDTGSVSIVNKVEVKLRLSYWYDGKWYPLYEKTRSASSIEGSLHQQRLSRTNSVNFRLRSGWSNSIPDGDVTVKADAEVNPNKTVPERYYFNNHLPSLKPRTYEFKSIQPLNLKFVFAESNVSADTTNAPIKYWDLQERQAFINGTSEAREIFNEMLIYFKAVMPIPGLRISFHPDVHRGDYNFITNKKSACNWLNMNLSTKIYDNWKPQPSNSYVFGLRHPDDKWKGGCSGPPRDEKHCSHVANGRLTWTKIHLMAHEMGHSFCRRHAPNGTLGKDGLPINDDCNLASRTDDNYPQYYGPQGKPYYRSSIGEVGRNIFTGKIYPPATHYDVMSYCEPRWISPYTWEGILEQMPHNPGDQSTPSDAVGVPHLLVEGHVINGQGEPRPFWLQELPEGSHEEPGEGPYRLELQDAAQNALFVRHFEVTQADMDEVEEPGWFDEDPCWYGEDPGWFYELVPFPQETARIVFYHEDEIIHVIERSPNAPTVTVLSPNGGEMWDGPGPYTVTWQAEDIDGDPLVADILYSANGGETWEILAANLSTVRYEIDALFLPGSDNVLVKVVVSDGVNTTADVSDAPFNAECKEPLVFMLWPEDGSNLTQGDLVSFSGLATDPEDGPMPSESLAWFSDIDGPLGVGTDVPLDALTLGEHEITLRATDSSGMVDTASVNIIVASTFFELDNLSISPSTVEPGGTVTISVDITNNDDEEGSQMVELRIDGIEEATQEVVLAPGGNETATFTLNRDIPGTYAVEIEGLTGEFTVIGEAEPTSDEGTPFNAWLIVGPILGVLLAGGVAYYLVRRRRVTSEAT